MRGMAPKGFGRYIVIVWGVLELSTTSEAGVRILIGKEF